MCAILNLDFYDGLDHYSDGNIEDELLEIVKRYNDFDELLKQDNRWPILYHLSNIRENILSWFPFKEEANLLEIGSGCGALTGLFCRKVKKVKAIELSKKRSLINFERNKCFDNLEIIVGNFENIKLDIQFDYITLIGVLEYAGSFINSRNPYLDFLLKIKSFLKESGVLFLAIENRFGLKYFAGAKEDHTGKLFDNISGYPNNKKVRTFGKIELEELLKQAGLSDIYFYYPHPDYKLPFEIYSQDYLPTIDIILSSAPNFDRERYVLFNESEVFRGIIKNKQYEFFANSFLVICKR